MRWRASRPPASGRSPSSSWTSSRSGPSTTSTSSASIGTPRRCCSSSRTCPGAAASDEIDAAERVCTAAGATLAIRAADPQEADWLRQGRRLAFRALEHLGVARMEDVGVPRSRVPEMLRAIEGIGERHDLRIGTFGHAGDGNLHPTFVLARDEDEAAAVPRLEAARDDLYEAALALGGTVTGEHGIGAARRDWLVRQRGEDAVAVMRAIKHALDPQNLLNPGRMLA